MVPKMGPRRTVNLYELLRQKKEGTPSPSTPAPAGPPPQQTTEPSRPHLANAASVADPYSVPYIDLKTHPPDEAVLTALPDWIIKNFNVLPHHYTEGGVLVVLTLNPYDITAEQAVRNYAGKVLFATTNPDDLNYFKERALNTLARQARALQEVTKEVGTQTPDGTKTEAQGAVPDFVNGLIREAILQGASDIHIEPTLAGGRIRFRIDGELQDHSTIQTALTRAVISRLKVSANLDPGESNLPQDGKITFDFNERRYRLRLSTVPTPYGESAVVRILPDSSHIPTLEDLGFLEDTLALYKTVLAKPYGVILITGPTGSGKTTTLFASLRERYRPTLKLVTVEDPVEYEFPGAIQTQVQPEIGRTFARLLRSFLRHDPDIIVVGEIRDAETAKIAMEAGLTGHLVLATLHANTAASTPIRLMEMGVQPYLFSNLLAVLSQRLVRQVCPRCAKPHNPVLPKELLIPSVPNPTFLKGTGCSHCRDTGYRGRMALHELLVFDPELHEVLMRQKSVNALEALAVKKGLRRLIQDGLIKAARGLTTVEEVLAKTKA